LGSPNIVSATSEWMYFIRISSWEP
jgi:hypothetical protein